MIEIKDFSKIYNGENRAVDKINLTRKGIIIP